MASKFPALPLLVFAFAALPAAAQSVSVPVVQPLPKGYQPGSGGSAPITPSAPAPAAPLAVPLIGPGSEWDEARSRLRAQESTPMALAVDRWKMLTRTEGLSFSDYSGFLLQWPGFPLEEKLRRNAEKAIEREGVDAARLAAYFDRFPPLTNSARARYALALSALHRKDATAQALAAWRGGPMADDAESAIAAMLAGRLTPADQDLRMDALLWAGANAQALRQIALVSPQRRPVLAARLAALTGNDDTQLDIDLPEEAKGDPGWLYNRARQLRRLGHLLPAAYLLANRPPLTSLPRDPEKWVDLQLDAAKDADDGLKVRIAAKIDDGFAPGTDISRLSYTLRDQYTSLMWLGGLTALWRLNDPQDAAPLFHRYGKAARAAQTRAKGYYWAGKAADMAGDKSGAASHFAAAAQFPDQFYGQLALERLGRPLPSLDERPDVTPTLAERRAFNQRPLTQAVREVAREADWPTATRFFREIAEQADSEADHVLVADLAKELGRRDLGVILGQTAHVDGHGIYRHTSFPLIPVPEGSNWTIVHAITRQESQFAMNAVSHAGARGLMQLMPGTAQMASKKVGLSYDSSALTGDASYNIRLGDEVFERNLSYYGGSYPLAIAAYNAGPGNVNKWLRANGDPRQGEVDWIDWIERIPFSETRGYVQHVLENAVVYEAMNPSHASYRGPNPLSHFIGKAGPG